MSKERIVSRPPSSVNDKLEYVEWHYPTNKLPKLIAADGFTVRHFGRNRDKQDVKVVGTEVIITLERPKTQDDWGWSA